MGQFPNLNGNQIAVLWADLSTGRILDGNYKYAISGDPSAYSIYDDINDAVEYAEKVLADRDNIECWMHDRNEHVVKYLRPPIKKT
jgi:hypothetical protein